MNDLVTILELTDLRWKLTSAKRLQHIVMTDTQSSKDRKGRRVS